MDGCAEGAKACRCDGSTRGVGRDIFFPFLFFFSSLLTEVISVVVVVVSFSVFPFFSLFFSLKKTKK